MLLINRSACKRAVLDVVKHRKQFTRVGADVYVHLHNHLLKEIKRIGDSHPSIGKTIMMGSKKRSKVTTLDEYDPVL